MKENKIDEDADGTNTNRQYVDQPNIYSILNTHTNFQFPSIVRDDPLLFYPFYITEE